MEHFGRFDLLEQLAVGGMAEVFLARTALLGAHRLCVIKRIRPSLSGELRFVSRFIDEASIAMGLHHPCIVEIYDFGQEREAYFLAMEYVPGLDLAELLSRLARPGAASSTLLEGSQAATKHQRMPVEAAAFIACQIAKGLHHAHEACDANGQPLHIVHRDVSPHNILIGNDGAVKLTDFGIASARDKLTKTSEGTVLGKAGYISPEHAGGNEVDRRMDVWSLGVCLYEMLSGAPLFPGEGPAQKLRQVLRKQISPIHQVSSAIPDTLSDIVMGCLKRDPAERTQSAGHVALQLNQWLANCAITFGPTELATLLSTKALSAGDAKRIYEAEDETRDIPAAAPLPYWAPSVSATLNYADDYSDPTSRMAINASITDEEVRDLREQLGSVPDLWLLVEIGERYAAIGNKEEAISALSCAALVYAHGGHLPQALSAWHSWRQHRSPSEASQDLHALATARGSDRATLQNLVAQFGGQKNLAYLLQAHPGDFLPFSSLANDEQSQDNTERSRDRKTPFLSQLSDDAFVEIGQALRYIDLAAGQILINEGAPGDSLFLVGKGRLLARCSAQSQAVVLPDGPAADLISQVSLASFSDGEFFGEFSFLTDQPRSATVEALVKSRVLELGHAQFDEVIAADPNVIEPLLDFYKERVVEQMMQRSPVFARLSYADRRLLLNASQLNEVEDQELIIEAGSKGDAFYFIKTGEVEVFGLENGVPVFIDKLSQGEFFGEGAAVTGKPRSANVRAMGDVSLFVMDASALQEVLQRQPQLEALLSETIAQRAQARHQRIEEQRVLFSSI